MKTAKTTRYRSVSVSPDHPLSQSISRCGRYSKVYKHRLILFEKIGNGQHDCHWCKKQIYWGRKGGDIIIADHLDGNEWNNDLGNLVPSCRRCNLARATRPDFLTHCPKGHEYTEENSYYRPDGDGKMCKTCCRERQRKRTLSRKGARK